MTTQTIRNAFDPAAAHAQTVQDLLLVSSFGVWAVLLGLIPALAFRMLMAG
jgi:hypothetical protein